MISFDVVLHATSTEKFCTSCHEMAENPLVQAEKTLHFQNASGVHASCSDCHVPKEFVPKMIRKVEAAREVWGTLTGIIDTPEKYAAHAPAMKQRELDRLPDTIENLELKQQKLQDLVVAEDFYQGDSDKVKAVLAELAEAEAAVEAAYARWEQLSEQTDA